MTSRILKGLYHFTVYTVGILVLLAAVFVTLVRLFLPDIGIYRSEVEAWVSKYMGFPVVFHSIDANWQGWIPELTLTDIDLLNRAGTQEITHFESARIQIAPVATIVERQFIPKSLTISGFKLTVIRRENGSISIQDIELENISDGQANNELAEWLFKQDEIEIQNAEIEWVDLKYKQDEPISLSNVAFKMRNDIGRFQIDGSAKLPENYGTDMDFAFDAFGNLLTSEWSGELYLSAKEINPDNWYKNIRPLEFDISGGIANIDAWMNWDQAKLTSLQGQLQYDDFEARVRDEQTLQLSNLSTRFMGSKTETNGWRFTVKLENLITENGAWPNTDISITTEPATVPGKHRYLTSFTYLKIGDLMPVISSMKFLPDRARAFLEGITIDGELHDVALRYNPDVTDHEQLYFETNFDRLSTNLGKDLPILTGLAGHIQGTLEQGKLVLQESQARVTVPSAAEGEIEITDLRGDVYWQKTADYWNLRSENIHLLTPDLTADITGSIFQETGRTPFIDLVLNINDTNLERISNYLPAASEFNLKNWMQKVFLGGTVNSASAVIRGRLEDFPFEEKDGRFLLIANVSDATLEYSQTWPVADQLYGEVKIDGKEMLTTIHNGTIFNAEITDAKVTIPDILEKEKTVALTGHIRGDINDLNLFIDQSPLHNHVALAEIRNAMQSGEFGLDLSLGIPIRQQEKKTEITGTIDFIDTIIDSPSMNIYVNEINGQVFFTRDAVSSEVLTAQYQAVPVAITLAGTGADPDQPYTITISGEGDEEFIADRLEQYVPVTARLSDQLRSKFSGTAQWQVKLAYLQDEQEKLRKHLDISSDLKGLQIDLPAPLGKRRYSSVPINISTTLSQDSGQEVLLSYSSDLHCRLQLDKESAPKLKLVRIYSGATPEQPESRRKFQISGSVNSLVVDEWIKFLDEITDDATDPHPVLHDIGIELEIAHLDLFKQDYYDVAAVGSKTDWGWSFNLDAEEIMGDVYLPANAYGEKQLTLLLNKLFINESNGQVKSESLFNPRHLPALSIEVDQFNHHGRDLGKLVLQSSTIYNGTSIDKFEFHKQDLLITGNGTWLADGEVEQSKFKVDLHAADMNSMFRTFGYDLAAIKDGETDFQIIADWVGSPMDFSLKNLNGRLDMQIKKGQLLDINPAAGRLFGLLSFQTLPRRLLLDFRDLFGKGMSFDKIEGKFDISNGNAYTNNLYMNSPTADVAITGRTGLAEQDYDQIVTVTPQVTESMPVAGAIFGPVGIGVGAVIYLVGEMFDSLNTNLENILKYQYTITGSWENPVIEKVREEETVAGG